MYDCSECLYFWIRLLDWNLDICFLCPRCIFLCCTASTICFWLIKHKSASLNMYYKLWFLIRKSALILFNWNLVLYFSKSSVLHFTWYNSPSYASNNYFLLSPIEYAWNLLLILIFNTGQSLCWANKIWRRYCLTANLILLV